jgi:putative Mg2+ transporter-C (MgtC) family protein
MMVSVIVSKGVYAMMIAFPDALLRLCAALLLGSIVGFERESDEQPAGLRTNALVALGCALFTVISAYGFLGFTNLSHVQIDPTRIASYIIAGIGFLGGGTIFVQKDPQKVKGLTTAAAIWVVAAIGVACGVGMYWEAILVTILVLIVLSILRFATRFFLAGKGQRQRLEVEVLPTHADQFISMLYELCERHGVKIADIKVHIKDDRSKIVLLCHASKEANIFPIIEALRIYKGVVMVNVALN